MHASLQTRLIIAANSRSPFWRSRIMTIRPSVGFIDSFSHWAVSALNLTRLAGEHHGLAHPFWGDTSGLSPLIRGSLCSSNCFADLLHLCLGEWRQEIHRFP